MLNLLGLFLQLIDKHVFWLYALLTLLIVLRLRAYALAHRERVNTVFSIEKEIAAHREGRAMSAIGTLLGIAAVVTAVKFYIVPSVDVSGLVEPEPTVAMHLPIPTPQETLTSTPTEVPQTSTPSPRPSRRPTSALSPTPTPRPQGGPPPQCPDPTVYISSPGMDAVVSGMIAVVGTANNAQFQFYKVELGTGAEPTAWHVLNDLHREPVSKGRLESLDTRSVPNGTYWLQLTVVDATGNFPPPCKVRIQVEN